MNAKNWKTIRDSIYHQMATQVILRFKKELVSLNEMRNVSDGSD